MRILDNKRYRLMILSGVILVLVIGIVVLLGDNEEEMVQIDQKGPSDGFTFLGLGASSRFTPKIRERLKAQLGSDVLETNTIIDLSVNHTGFLKRFFQYPCQYR